MIKGIKMKKLIVLAILLFTTPALADYTMELKNSTGTVLKTYTITDNQVAHLQKAAAATGKSVVNQIKEAILDTINHARVANKKRWLSVPTNDDYIDEQSRQ